MQTNPKLLRPESLHVEMIYLRVAHSLPSEIMEYEPVKFLGYDPCPALVWIRGADGRVTRCPRDELFLTISSFDNNSYPR